MSRDGGRAQESGETNPRQGNDTIYGLAGNDNLIGDKGDDRLFGGDGWDRLVGGDWAETTGEYCLEGENIHASGEHTVL